MSAGMTYGDYLRLDPLLACQTPVSACHDELLFIVIHQASELWLKLTLHELGAARRSIASDSLQPALKNLARVGRVQVQLIQSWEILATMTPTDYGAFRSLLGTSSGFQSHQYRLLEFLMGAKNSAMVDVHMAKAEVHAQMVEALHEPSLYDETLRLLARHGFAIPADTLDRDFSQPYRRCAAVEEAWRQIYRDPDEFWPLYELAEKLVDLEQRLQQWRFAHLKTVERIIGSKSGTGGTSGASYLERVLHQPFFPELLSVRALL